MSALVPVLSPAASGNTGGVNVVALSVLIFFFVVITAGGFDLRAEVVCESDEHLLEVISGKIRRISGVVGTETFMYLKLRKQTYSWGVR